MKIKKNKIMPILSWNGENANCIHTLVRKFCFGPLSAFITIKERSPKRRYNIYPNWINNVKN